MSSGSHGSTPPGILAAIGRTPLVELCNLLPGFGGRVFAKLERSNPGGSIKDRTAYAMLRGPLESGELVPGRSVVVESSSGNLAIGLAQVCRYFDLRLVCVVDARTTSRNLAQLAAYQAEVEVITEPDPASGEYLPARLARVRELAATIPHAFWPNQYTNPLNPAAHQETMAEIADELGGRVDYLFASASTFGTLRGCADYIRATGMATRVIGVDAMGSVIFGREAGPRLLPGHGASVVPPLTDPSLIDEVVHVSDLDSVVACRRLLHKEAVLAGGSSGAVVAALDRLSSSIPDGAHCVLIFADGGDRYLDTIFSDAWVTANFGDVAHLWAPRDLSGV